MTAAKCPICGKPAETKFRPFCSARCANIDLHRWLNDGYSIAGDGEDEAPPGDADETP
jgi:endogenous inhibitor of DNA gyrase (YacG/DUF329 family)